MCVPAEDMPRTSPRAGRSTRTSSPRRPGSRRRRRLARTSSGPGPSAGTWAASRSMDTLARAPGAAGRPATRASTRASPSSWRIAPSASRSARTLTGKPGGLDGRAVEQDAAGGDARVDGERGGAQRERRRDRDAPVDGRGGPAAPDARGGELDVDRAREAVEPGRGERRERGELEAASQASRAGRRRGSRPTARTRRRCPGTGPARSRSGPSPDCATRGISRSACSSIGRAARRPFAGGVTTSVSSDSRPSAAAGRPGSTRATTRPDSTPAAVIPPGSAGRNGSRRSLSSSMVASSRRGRPSAAPAPRRR